MPALSVILLLILQSDPIGMLSHARRAQAEFERVRLLLLPAGAARPGAAGRCDTYVGRFCYWSDPGDTATPHEPPAIAPERARLLAVLDSVAQALPGDPWVAGQRVRYLLEAGQSAAAAAVARSCAATSWWCAALQGLVEHEAGSYEAAGYWFETALAAMPEDERCHWTDLSDLLEGPLRRRYRALSCGERHGFESRVWWLAQPLWSLSGNDRLTEHYARVTMTRVLERARSPYGLWGADERELIVRYGWPRAWEVDAGGSGREPVAIGYEPEPSFHFLPDAQAFDGPSPGDLPGALESRAARERYAPRYATTFVVLEPDFATFRRGDSTIVVAGFNVAGDTSFQERGRAAALVLERDEQTPPVVERRSDAEREGVLVARAPWRPAFLSVELLAPQRRAAARARFALPAPSAGISLSGILPYEPGDSLPADLVAALARVHVGGVPRGDRIGVFWEVYGLAPAQEVSTAVTVTPERSGWLRRVAAAIGLASRKGGVRVEWREEAQPQQGRTSRALVLDLKGLSAGRYRVDLTVSPASGEPATATRRLDIVGP